jgi:hypothetical protein
MTNKTGHLTKTLDEQLEIAHAIERYVAQGGIISVVAEGESGNTLAPVTHSLSEADAQVLEDTKVAQLKVLVAKGAGVTALQYSLRMNRKEIRRLANENGVKILYSRPVRRARSLRSRKTTTVDDSLAGHAMHYSTLGYTVPEIAQLLNLSVRDIWNIGRAYRFEFKSKGKADVREPSISDAPE